MKVELIATRGNIAEMRIDGRAVFVPYIVEGTQVSFKYEGETYSIDNGEKTSRSKRRHRDHSMSAPMPGVILKVLASQGQQVTKGMPLVILEAMKMEHVIAAPRDGTVAAINCKEGELVQPGNDLIELQ
ncbi:MAG TPA: biotin/lipoyl-containing protein [Thermoanaerobaculia bacterium]